MALYVYDLSPVKTGATETKLTRNTCLLYAGICKIYYAKKNMFSFSTCWTLEIIHYVYYI